MYMDLAMVFLISHTQLDRVLKRPPDLEEEASSKTCRQNSWNLHSPDSTSRGECGLCVDAPSQPSTSSRGTADLSRYHERIQRHGTWSLLEKYFDYIPRREYLHMAGFLPTTFALASS